METPNTDRLRPRLSSSVKKSRKSVDNSASKLVKTLINKEKLRKINQYKVAKTKRAEILVKNRHITEDEEEKIEIDDPEKENYSFDNQNFSTINEEENMSIKIEPSNEIKQPVGVNQQGGITSKISVSIMRRINSFKSTIKNIVTINSNMPKPKVEPNVPKTTSLRRSISMSCIPNQTKYNVKCLKKQDSFSSIQSNNQPAQKSNFSGIKNSNYSLSVISLN